MKPLSRRLAVLLLGLFILLSLVTVLRHEMWRDELQAWLLAKEQTSFGDLSRESRYDKHPLAWYVVLFLITRLTCSPLAMQLLHIALAALSAWLVLRFAPFSRFQKVLLIFGYYLLFEYNIISRNYALGVLALFLFCVFFTRRPEKPLPSAVCLFLLANTSLYGLILAFAGGAAMLVQVVADRSRRRQWLSCAALLLIGAGGLLSILQLRPTPGASYDQVSRLHTSFNAGLAKAVLRILPEAYLQMPRPAFHFWNTHFLDRVPLSLAVSAALALLCLVFGIILLGRSRPGLVFFVLSTAGILAWLYLASVGFVRHRGHLYLALIAALWLARGSPASPEISPPAMPGRGKTGSAALSAVLTVIFAVQAAGGLFAAGMDIVHPFSQAKAIAGYIRQKGIAGLPIVGEMDYLMVPVCGYLGRRIYFIRGERLGSYVKWDMKRFQDVSPQVILERAEQLARKKRQDCLILLGFHLDPGLERPGYLTKLTATGRAIVRGEIYRLYRLKYTGPSPSGGEASLPLS